MWRFACDNLLSRPVRSSLATLGLAVAIGGMVGLFSIAGGIHRLVDTTFAMIPGLLVQQRGSPFPLFSSLPAAWEQEIAGLQGVAVVNAEVLARVNVLQGAPVITPPRFLLGFDLPSRVRLRQSIYGEHMVSGRFLAPADADSLHCVISRQIAQQTKVEVGGEIEVNAHRLTVVGVYDCGTLLLDVNILCDLGTVRRLTRYSSDSVSSYYVEPAPGVPLDALAKRIERHFAGRSLQSAGPSWTTGAGPLGGGWGSLLGAAANLWEAAGRAAATIPGSVDEGTTDRNGSAASETNATSASGASAAIMQETAAAAGDEPPAAHAAAAVSEHSAREDAAPEDATPMSVEQRRQRWPESPVEVRSPEEWSDRVNEFTGDLNLFLSLMTAVGVVIAVLSILNTMLMSVAERSIEFGILRANGWSRRDIMKLVTCESTMLGVAGGLLGAAGGWGSVQAINAAWPLKAHLFASPQLLVVSLLFSTVLGVLGGLYPAWRAARMSPMDAIRRG